MVYSSAVKARATHAVPTAVVLSTLPMYLICLVKSYASPAVFVVAIRAVRLNYKNMTKHNLS